MMAFEVADPVAANAGVVVNANSIALTAKPQRFSPQCVPTTCLYRFTS